MELKYPGKKTEKEILDTNPCLLNQKWEANSDKLILGENLLVMKALIDKYNMKSKVNLVYIDPPFSTNNGFKIGNSRVSTISSSLEDKTAYDDKITGEKFIEFIRQRLILIRELMAETASIYIHIDCKIGHYIKIIMDEVFGAKNFRNDITRIKCSPKNFERKAYGNIKDMILFYTKSKNSIWNCPKDEFTKEDISRLFKKIDKDGRKYTTIPLHAPGETQNGSTGSTWRGIKPPKGRHWRSSPEQLEKLDKEGLIEWSSNRVPRKKIYEDEKTGKKKQDIWEYKDPQYPSYPTEKNIDILRNIINASSNRGDIVLDCFCGSGTTLQAAQELGRNWIGIDQSKEAVRVTINRLSKIKNNFLFPQIDYQYLESVT